MLCTKLIHLKFVDLNKTSGNYNIIYKKQNIIINIKNNWPKVSLTNNDIPSKHNPFQARNSHPEYIEQITLRKQ